MVLAAEFYGVEELAAVGQTAREVSQHPAVGRELRIQYLFVIEARAAYWEYVDYLVDLHEAEFRWSWSHPADAHERWLTILTTRGLQDLRPIRRLDGGHA